jgi:hypothetical protein
MKCKTGETSLTTFYCAHAQMLATAGKMQATAGKMQASCTI